MRILGADVLCRMSRFGLMALLVLGVVSFAVTAHADSFDLAVPTSSGGSANWAGGSTNLILSSIGISEMTDLSLSYPTATNPIALVGSCGKLGTNACLNITAGKETAVSTSEADFAANSTPSSFTVIGFAPAAGITIAKALLTGTVTGAKIIPTFSTSSVDISTTINTIDPALLAYFGSSGGNFGGSLNVALTLNSGSFLGSSFTSTTLSGDLIEDPTPEAGSFALVGLGLALVGFAVIKRRNGSEHTTI
jgi:hypothetical protein